MNQPTNPPFDSVEAYRLYLDGLLTNFRILVVDDDPDILNGTVRLLEKAGYTVDRASSGEEALQIVRIHRPDLLLLDRHLPGIDGLEVCRRIKLDPAMAHSVVVIVSASHAESDQQAEGLESGADGYIGRPIANRELLARVGSFVRILNLTRSLHLHIEEMGKSKEAARQAQLASLNLMEEAVAVRDRAEQATQQLRESRERYQMLFNAGGDAIFVHGFDANGVPGRFVEVNTTACQRLGYTREELLELSPGGIDLPGVVLAQEIAQELREKRHLIFESVHVAKDGTQIPVEIGAHLFDMNGVTLCLSVARDLTERRQADYRYKTILKTTMDGFIIFDSNSGRFQEVNDAFCEIIGYSREELLRMQIADIEASETPAEILETLEKSRGQKYVSIERQNCRKDGVIIDVVISIQISNHYPDRSIAFYSDITEQKRAEEELHKRALELEIFNNAMVGREGRVIELKEEVNRLCAELGREAPYPPVWE